MCEAAFDMEALIAHLETLSDSQYRSFNLSLIPNHGMDALGVRVPLLRAVAKDISKGDWRAFLSASCSHPLHEIRMLHAIVLGNARCPIEEKIQLIDTFLPCVNNWAVCDALCASCRPRRTDEGNLFELVCACANSGLEFRKRFGLVMMMNHYRDDLWADRVLAAYSGFNSPYYYARMGAAWGLATLFLYQREGVLSILRSDALDVFTHNMAIRKLRESRRVAEPDKRMLSTLLRPAGKPDPAQDASGGMECR